MANTSSAKKAIRVAARRGVINLRRRRGYKEAKRDVEKAITNNKKTEISDLLKKAYKEIDKAVKLDVLHKNTGARYKSNLAKKVKALA